MLMRGWPVAALVLVGTLVAGQSYAVPPRDLPPSGTDFDYQLGGSWPVSERVGVVVRDREASQADGLYNVCYVNGSQTQSSEKKFWRKHWGLVLKHDGGPVEDEGCAEDGFDAVELDNLDSFSRSRELIVREDTKRFARRLVRRAHLVGLAAAQKNMAGWDGRRAPSLETRRDAEKSRFRDGCR